MQENRHFPRVAAQCNVKYRLVGDDPQFLDMTRHDGVVQNISGGGVCVEVHELLNAGTMLAVDLELPGLPTSVIALGKVVWCRPAAPTYEAGIEFWWIGWRDEAAQTQIRRFIAQKLRADVTTKA